jgi:hypothetical protein
MDLALTVEREGAAQPSTYRLRQSKSVQVGVFRGAKTQHPDA